MLNSFTHISDPENTIIRYSEEVSYKGFDIDLKITCVGRLINIIKTGVNNGLGWGYLTFDWVFVVAANKRAIETV